MSKNDKMDRFSVGKTTEWIESLAIFLGTINNFIIYSDNLKLN